MPCHFEHLQDDWWVARLPDGDWGLFEWRPDVQTMEHIDTQPERPHFGGVLAHPCTCGVCAECSWARGRDK